MRTSLARALTGTALTIGMLAAATTGAAADDTYTVRAGDTLSGIARSVDGVSSWQQLADRNSDTVHDPDVLRVGEVLSIPGSTSADGPDVHTVVAGDTLADIAGTYASVSSWRDLHALNADTVPDPDVIEIDQVLVLSGEAADLEVSASSATPEPAPEPEPAPAPASSSNTSTWDRLAECESSGDWSINTGNGYYGGLQFSQRSWEWVGGAGMPHQASKSEQIARAEILLDRQGWGAWPACSRKLGLR